MGSREGRRSGPGGARGDSETAVTEIERAREGPPIVFVRGSRASCEDYHQVDVVEHRDETVLGVDDIGSCPKSFFHMSRAASEALVWQNAVTGFATIDSFTGARGRSTLRSSQ